MSAPIGNRNAASGAEWRHALKWALDNYASKSVKRGQALRQIGLKLVGLALKGNLAAIEEIGNRLDGRPVRQDSADPFDDPAGASSPIKVVLPYNGRGPKPGESIEDFRRRNAAG